jgi:nitroreductase
MTREAAADHPTHDLITDRWSPYAYSDRPVSHADLHSLFEAARWAASSYNEQPWSFLIATRDDAQQFAKVLACLTEANQAWASRVPVLVLTFAAQRFTRNNKPNRVAMHDVALAVANLTMEATSRGLSVHQMAGILPEKIRETYAIPDDVEPVTAVAIGYAAAPEDLPDEVQARETAPRERKPLAEFLFSGDWGSSWEHLK